jgi:signal transduction histidine kinase
MHLELGRSACTLTLVEAVLVLALFALQPIGVVVAAAAGEAGACLLQRQSTLKVAFNTAATALAAVAAALAYAALVGPGGGVGSWWPALVGVACFAVVGHASTSWVLAAVGEGSFEAVWLVSAGLAAAASATSGSVGLALHALSLQGRVAPFLLAPLIAVLGLEARRAAAHEGERLRFERLADASGRAIGLQSFTAALSQSATESRMLVTGAASVCCAPDNLGTWRGVMVDDGGSHTAPDATVAAVIGLAAVAAGREVPMDGLSTLWRAALPGGASVVVAGTDVSSVVVAGTDFSSVGMPDADPIGGVEPPAGIALAVFRDLARDGQGSARARVLGAFATHAALITTNALLFERVEDALRRQVDANRHKDEFVAAVSHELRTPLASVLGSVDTLARLEGRMSPEARERFFGIARRQGQRLRRMIEELLLTASVEHRTEKVVVEDVDLVRLLHEVSEDLADQADGRMVVRIDGDVAGIRTDGDKLRRIIANLAENAAKFAADGPIELRAATGVIGEARRALVRVVDHGPGIAPGDRARAVERFVQLDGSSTRAHGGTGLGLYLCGQIAELLAATVWVGDTPGGGATFAVSLPVDLEAATAAGVPGDWNGTPQEADIPVVGLSGERLRSP